MAYSAYRTRIDGLKPKNTIFTVALLALSAILLVGTVPLGHASADSCSSYTVTYGSVNYEITVTAANGTCPLSYSNSGIEHLILLTSTGANPYSISVVCQTAGCTTPTNIEILGWANNYYICGGNATACSTSGPWTGSLDATVQANQACNTAPLKINGAAGQPDLILEAGTGGDCSTTTTTTVTQTPPGVPQFPGFGLLAAIGLLLPLMFLLRGRLPSLKH